MDHIDVHDLPEEDARLLATFVEFLRRQKQRRLSEKLKQRNETGRLALSHLSRETGTTTKMPSTITGESTTMYQRGDVVLLPFPFTDLSATRTRPAVVVSVPSFEQETSDFTVAMITSVPHTTPYDYALQDWQAAHLLRPSWVRTKLAT
jgi:PemK-like, MazF-like toxin of type II toxin-antitoxin system